MANPHLRSPGVPATGYFDALGARQAAQDRGAPHRRAVGQGHLQATRRDGGKRIIGYDARCRRGTGRWQEQSAHASPIRFASVTTAPVQCQVRAVNAKGRGKWRAKASG